MSAVAELMSRVERTSMRVYDGAHISKLEIFLVCRNHSQCSIQLCRIPKHISMYARALHTCK